MINWSQCPAIERIPGKVSGAWLFKNTRVPVKALFENIEGGATIQEFLRGVKILFDQDTAAPLHLWPADQSLRNAMIFGDFRSAGFACTGCAARRSRLGATFQR
jgi:hypothetical protein